MDDWNLDEKSLGKRRQLQHYKSIFLPTIYKEWPSNVGLTFSVGDNIPRFTISVEQDN